jgi:hypothetical protein
MTMTSNQTEHPSSAVHGSPILEMEAAGAIQFLPTLERIAVALQAIARVQRPEFPVGLQPDATGILAGSTQALPPEAASGVSADSITKLDAQLTEIRGLLKRQESLLRPVQKTFYSIEEVAEVTSYKPWTVRQACNKGRIKAKKGEDGRWRVPHDELTRLQEEGLSAE